MGRQVLALATGTALFGPMRRPATLERAGAAELLAQVGEHREDAPVPAVLAR
jgi:hypothetical protein